MAESSGDALECAVCFELFEDPVSLPCRHVLCLSCARFKGMEAHARTAQPVARTARAKSAEEFSQLSAESKAAAALEGWESFACPVCGDRCQFDLSVECLGLETNEAARAAVAKQRCASAQCSGCESTLVESYCEQCAAWFCEECAVLMHSMAKFRSHTKSVNPPSPQSSTKRREPLCREHGKVLDLCCVEDEVLVCSQCVASDRHRRLLDGTSVPHEFKVVSEMSKVMTAKLTAGVEACAAHCGALDEARQHVVVEAARLYKECAKAKTDVNLFFHDLASGVQRVREQQLKEVDAFYEKQHQAYELQMGVLGSARSYVSETMDIARRVVESGKSDSVSLLRRAKSVVSRLDESRVLCIDQLSVSETSVEFVGGDHARIVDGVKRYGSVKFTLYSSSTGAAAVAATVIPSGEHIADTALNGSAPPATQAGQLTPVDGTVVLMVAELRRLPDVQTEHGRLYELGDKALTGSAKAMCTIGYLFGMGCGVAQSDATAMKWYLKSAELGYADGQFKFGVGHDGGRGVAQSPATAVEWYRKAAEQGFADAQFNLGVMYSSGRGVAQNDETAVEWYRKAAEQGQREAQCSLGVMYTHGRGVTQSHAEAVEWLRKSAQQSLKLAQFNLGLMYEFGRGVAKDDATAVEWYRKSAEQGHSDAQYFLGMRSENGHGVAWSCETAMEWYRKSAEQGHTRARAALARLRGW